MDLITLTKDDSEFESYLNGTFSANERALPVETYHAETPRERVTFRIVALSNLQVPVWWKVYFWACRPDLLVLTMGPAVAAWLNHPEFLANWTKWPSWLALLGIFFLHAAVVQFNDVQDHRRGSDRQNRRRGSQVIQKGWVSAARLQRYAWLNAGLAVIFGLPAFIHAPFELLLVCGLAVPALILVVRNTWARWGISDLALGLLFGPLLVCGVSLASFSVVNNRDLLLGFAFGMMTVWTLQVRQFENLFRSRAEGFRTWLGYWDFDRARTMVVVLGGLLLVTQPALVATLGAPLLAFAFLPLACAPMILLIGRLKRAASPLSSSLLESGKWALAAQMAWTAWWILALGAKWL